MSTKKSGLGRGFDSLIPTDLSGGGFDDVPASGGEKVLIQDILPNPDQPRKKFDVDAQSSLIDSIEQHGVLQPILVMRTEDGKFLLIAGERRYRAAQHLNHIDIPAVIRTADELAQLEMALIENIQREDLTPLELAMGFHRLFNDHGLKTTQIAKRVGKSQSTISNTMRLLNLPEDAKTAMREGKINEGHARAILSLTGIPDKQAELLALILKHGWTQPRAEQFVTAVKNKTVDSGGNSSNAVRETKETKQISKSLDTKVQIRRLAKGGRIIVSYKDDADLERITKQIAS